MKKLILLTVLLPFCSFAQLDSDKDYTLIANGSNSKVYLHTPSIEYVNNDNSKMIVWISVLPKKKSQVSWWTASFGVDCRINQIKTLRVTNYRKNGDVLGEDTNEYSWEAPIPSSVAYQSMQAACTYKKTPIYRGLPL